MASLLPLFVAVPLIAAGVLVMTGYRHRTHTSVLLGVLVTSLIVSAGLVAYLVDAPPLAHGVGGWSFGVAIPLAADMFAALMLTTTAVGAIACVCFAMAAGTTLSRFFAPLVLVLMAGVNGALLTVDLFNLFVFVEVMLLPAYGLYLLARPGKAPLKQIAGARLYVTLNLLTSTVFLTGIGFVYGTAGTVNLAQLAGMASLDGSVAFAVAVCLFALGIKASVVPVHGWLARTYPSTSPAVTALFSGLHTKVAIVAIYRIYAVVFVTMVVGVLGAVGEKTTRSILTFHMVSQIGYVLIGVGLFTQAGLTASIFYLIHNMIVKTALFLATGAVEVRHGTGELGKVTGLAKTEPVLAVAFFIAAMSMAGLPPFSGFVAKLALILATLEAGQIAVAVAALAVSLVTLLSMLKIWGGVFWGEPAPDATPAGSSPGGAVATATRVEARPRIGAALMAPAVGLAVITLVLGVGAEPLLSLTHIAAAGLIDPSAYLEAVIGS